MKTISLLLAAALVAITIQTFAADLDLVPTHAGRWATGYEGIDGDCWTNGFAGDLDACLTNNVTELKVSSDQAKTYTFWLKPSTLGTFASCTGSTNSFGWFFNRDADAGLTVWYSLSGTAYATPWGTTFSLPLNEWSFVVVVIDNITDRIQASVNGSAWEEKTFTGAVNTSSFPFAVGGRWASSGAPGSSMLGLYDESYSWDRALTQAEVEELWNGGTGKFIDSGGLFE